MTRQGHRRAEWVWRERGLQAIPFGVSGPSAAEEQNRYIYFRHTFTLEQPAQAAPVMVSADGRYQLYVNGQLVGRGPARCHPAQQQADSYDLRSYLQTGLNVIAALVHSYGRLTAWYELSQWEASRAFGSGGFFLQGEAVMQGITLPLDTGKDWRHLESSAWERAVPSGSLGFIERYDARQEPVGWNTVDFDDSDWKMAEVLRIPGRQFTGDIVPFPLLSRRDIPALHEEIVPPAALLHVGEVVNAPPAGDIATLFEAERLAELTQCTATIRSNPVVTPLRHTVDADFPGVTISTAPGRSVSLVVDFGRIVTGRVRFEVDAPAGAILDFTHSERLHRDGRVLIHKGIPVFDVPQAHRVTLRAGRQTWEAFEWVGFRYVQITARNCEQPLTLHNVHIHHSAYPVEHRGRFACSDELLNRIWTVGANTVHLCMHDAYVDCPSREQRQYMGDGYVQMLVNFAAFGDTALAARLLRQMAYSQQPDGLLMMCAPGDFSRLKVLNIPDFTLYWIMTLWRYAQYTADIDIVRELFPVLVRAVAWFERYLNAESLLTDVPHWIFVDWAELDKKGQVTALNAQFVAALHAAAGLARLVNQPDDANYFESLAACTTTSINLHLWDETRGVYVDARGSRRVSQQANAAVIAFDVAPPERWSRILDVIMDESRLVLTRTGEEIPGIIPFDESWQVVVAQPFYGHHLHRALSKAGRYGALLDHIRRRWGALVEAGDGTFRETWQVNEATSLCHGWASTPTHDLTAEVLGVTPLEPGFTTFRVAPQPAGLAWAEGAVPTPHGEIEIAWRWENDHFNLALVVPEYTTAEVVLPGVSVIYAGPGEHRIINAPESD
ncbi:MAG: family 78 glycoside hydrolase catalytic domain [Anaerolineaceae bacterium]|nr:family 78 glycoside hydrolase catalytic domain [Anaerolineaceae bacterium]